MPSQNGDTKDPYDTRRLAMSSGYPPQQIPQTFGYYQTHGKPACCEPSQAERYTLHQQAAYACANRTAASDVALDMRAPPFQHLSAGQRSDSCDRLTAETNLYTRSTNGIAATAAGVAATTHRKVGVVPFGMSNMY